MRPSLLCLALVAFALPAAAQTVTVTDPTFRGPGAVVADRLNGAPLPAAEGPLRLIVPGDLKPTRSVRNLIAIRLESLAAAAHPATEGQSRIPAKP